MLNTTRSPAAIWAAVKSIEEAPDVEIVGAAVSSSFLQELNNNAPAKNINPNNFIFFIFIFILLNNIFTVTKINIFFKS